MGVKKPSKKGGGATAKVYKFSAEVTSEAVLAVNAQETISQAFMEAPTLKEVTIYPSMVGKTKIGVVGIAGNILKAQDCDWKDNSDAVIDAKPAEACPMSIMMEICQWDIEQAYFSEGMKDLTSTVQPELAAIIQNILALKAGEELELLTWQGNTELDEEEDPLLYLCDGYEKLLKDAYDEGNIPTSQVVNSRTVTTQNVIATLTEAFQKMPKNLNKRKRTGDVKFFVSSDIVDAYLLATAAQSNEVYFLTDRPLSFLGMPLTEALGASDGVIAISRKVNFGMLTDLVGDVPSFNVVDMSKTTNEPKWRVRANVKYGVVTFNENEFVIMLPSITPIAAPIITTVAPNSGAVGDTVTLTGTSFTGATSVKFGTVEATTFTVVSATSITVTVPAGLTAGAKSVTVETPAGISDGVTFTVTE